MYSQMADKLKTCTRGQDFFYCSFIAFFKVECKNTTFYDT